MSAGRTGLLIVSIACIAMVLVGLRWEQTRLTADLLKLEASSVALRREAWALQAQLATLRAPQRLRRRIQFLDFDRTQIADRRHALSESFWNDAPLEHEGRRGNEVIE